MLPLRNLVPEYSPSPGMVRVISGVLLLLSAVCVSAARIPPPKDGARQGPPPMMRGGNPPQEALDACSDKSEQSVCSMSTPRGARSGTCGVPQGTEVLACMPEGMRRGRGNPDFSQARGPQRSNNRPPFREHEITKSGGLDSLYTASEAPIAESQFESRIEGEWRIINTNSISKHKTGEFPNADNPNTISVFAVETRIPASPVKTEKVTRVKVPGFAFNGVSFDPGAGEFYQGDPSKGWQYEPLSGAVALGLDENHAHVQPSGKYHYHGLPTGLLERFGVTQGSHSPQIGLAVDGFPIYALYGFSQMDGGGGVHQMKSSYRLKSGARPTGQGQPGGTHDGTFTADYEYISGLGDLDECNGRVTVTPDFPYGTYAYYLTDSYPVIPRCVMGTPDPSSRRKRR